MEITYKYDPTDNSHVIIVLSNNLYYDRIKIDLVPAEISNIIWSYIEPPRIEIVYKFTYNHHDQNKVYSCCGCDILTNIPNINIEKIEILCDLIMQEKEINIYNTLEYYIQDDFCQVFSKMNIFRLILSRNMVDIEKMIDIYINCIESLQNSRNV